MDAVTFSLSLLFILLSFFYIRYYWNTYRKLAKLPQYKGHFIFGNLEFFTGKMFEKHTTPLHKRIFDGMNGLMTDENRSKNVFLFWLSFYPFVLLTSAKSVEKLLTSTKLLEKSQSYALAKPWLSTGLLTSGSAKWKSRRKLLTPTFHFRILNNFIPIMNKHSKILVQKLREKNGQSLDIVDYASAATLDIICETAMGVSINAQQNEKSKYVLAVMSLCENIFNRVFDIRQWIDIIYYRMESGRNLKKQLDYVHKFTEEVIKSRKREIIEAKECDYKKINEALNEDDSIYLRKKNNKIAFMDLLINLHLEGMKPHGSSDFTLEDIREEVNTFMFGGFDTTSAALTWTLHLLGHHEDIQEKAYEEIYSIFGDDIERQVTEADLHQLKYVELCIKEALRLYPPAPLFARKATEDIDICGYSIAKNSTISIYTYGLHRDPMVFPDPEKYIPERFLPENCLKRHPFAYVPFSAGPRNCIGQKFAMMELKLTIAEILRNFKLQSTNKNIAISIELVIKAREAVLMQFISRY